MGVRRISDFFVREGDRYAFGECFKLLLEPPDHYARLDLFRDWSEAVEALMIEYSPEQQEVALRSAEAAYDREMEPGRMLADCLDDNDGWSHAIATMAIVELEKINLDVFRDDSMVEVYNRTRSRLDPGDDLADVLGNAVTKLYGLAGSAQVPERYAALYVLAKQAAEFQPNCSKPVKDYMDLVQGEDWDEEARRDPRFAFVLDQLCAAETNTDHGPGLIRSDVPLTFWEKVLRFLGSRPNKPSWLRLVGAAGLAVMFAATCALVVMWVAHSSDIARFEKAWIDPIRNKLK